MEKWKNIRKLSKVSLMVVLLFLPVPLVAVAGQARLDIPKANLEVSNAVPIGLIKKIALEKSKETWGPGAVGDPIPLSDLNGNLVVYMVPFSIGKEEFPKYDEVLQGIKQGRELKELIKNSEMEKARQMYQGMDSGKVPPQRAVIISESVIPPRPPMDPVRPDGSMSRKKQLEEIRNMEKFAAKKAMGADEFGTIFVSATYNMFPVLAYFHYLAPYYISFDLALERAEQAIGQGAFLKSIYFLGLGGQYFEFVSNSSSTLLNSKNLQATTLKELKSSRMPEFQPQWDSSLFDERKEKISAELAKEWDKIKSEVEKE